MKAAVRNPGDPIPNLAIGQVIEVDGAHVVAELDSGISELSRVYGGDTYPIGQFGSVVKIHFGRRIIYGYVGRLRMRAEYERERGVPPTASANERVIEVDIFGEGEWVLANKPPRWELRFERGVATFPLPRQILYLTPKAELQFIYGRGTHASASIRLGEHVGAAGTPCYADMNDLLGKHTAILGSTGSGKSGTVAVILHALIERGRAAKHPKWNPRIIVMDPHDEYHTAFPSAEYFSADNATLSLPYWMLDLEGTVTLIIGRTEHAATSQTNIVKNALLEARIAGAQMLGIPQDKITVDSPVPYILGDPTGLDTFGKKAGADYLDGFVGAINRQRPPNKNQKDHEDFNKILRKLETLLRDSRMSFMMKPWDGAGDPLPRVIAQLLGPGDPVRIIDLSGVPNEVAGATSAAVARTIFNVKLRQERAEREKDPVLLVCEEAHRYVPSHGEAMYAAAQEAVKRIAKEGRKYGIGMLLVSQRPGEVEATVLSQCNSWVAHRITNEVDREHVRAILPDSLAGLSKVLSGLRRREAIFVGQAALLPSRILVDKLPDDKLPQSHDIDFDKGWQTDPMTEKQLEEVAKRWRTQET